MLDTIHAHAARQHQHHDDEHRGNDLVPFFIEYGGNDVERVVFRIEPEQMENPRHAQHTENDEARQKKDRDDRQQIHHSIKGNEKAEPGRVPVFFLDRDSRQSRCAARIQYRKSGRWHVPAW